MAEEARKTVLIVDDEAWVHEIVGALLRARGYAVLSAMSGQEGLDKVYQTVPALLILDFQMPGMEGGAVFEKLRSKALVADLPVIFLSSLPFSNQVQRVPLSRNVRFSRKPIEPEELMKLVVELIGR